MNELEKRKMIISYKQLHPDESNYAVAKYFKSLNISQSTVYNIINKYDATNTVDREDGSGTTFKKLSESQRKSIVTQALQNKSKSQRELAMKFDVSQSTVNDILQKASVHAYKKSKRPYATEQQQEKQVVRIDRLYRLILSEGSPSIIMDDESYFTTSHSNLPGNKFYYAVMYPIM